MDFEFGFEDSSDFNFNVEDLQVKQTKKIDRMKAVKQGGSISGEIVYDNGTAYFGAMDGYVYAVDVQTSEVRWKFRTNGAMLDEMPLIEKEKLLMGSYDGFMYCLDKTTGTEIWKIKTGGIVGNKAALLDNKVVFGSMDGFVYACNLETGRLLWTFKTGDEIYSCATAHNGRIFVSSYDTYLYCLSSGGKEIWRFKTGREIVNTSYFEIEDDVIYFGSFDNFLYAINAETGREVWRFRTGKYGNASVPSLYKGVLYYGCRDGIFYAINAKTGQEIWRFEIEGEGVIDKKPLIFDNKVFFGGEDGNVYCLTLKGKELWRKKTPAPVFSSVTIAGNMLLFGGWDCYLYALDMNGNELWRIPTSTLNMAYIPPAYECFKVEIRKNAETFGTGEDSDSYSSKIENLNLSDYSQSEYSAKSEYVTKSEYTTEFVIFEGVMNLGDNLWILKDSETLISKMKISK